MTDFLQHPVAPIACKPWQLNGLSEALIVGHYENAYGFAVRTLNAIRADLAALDLNAVPGHRIRALKREEMRAWSSVHLHELYFETLGGDGAAAFTGTGPGRGLPAQVADALTRDFGGPAAWRRQFGALAAALNGGSGWAVLAYSRPEGRLTNLLFEDHAHGMLDAVPLLVLDMYEHAYEREFGANVSAYIDAFLRNVDWDRVHERLMTARSDPAPAADDSSLFTSVEELALDLSHGAHLQVIDARPRHYYSRAEHLMSGATWRDPDAIAEWSKELTGDARVVVYCAYGFAVGCDVANALRQRGLDAKYVRGGLAAWYAAGGDRAQKHGA